jgi:hypothetical protein
MLVDERMLLQLDFDIHDKSERGCANRRLAVPNYGISHPK